MIFRYPQTEDRCLPDVIGSILAIIK